MTKQIQTAPGKGEESQAGQREKKKQNDTKTTKRILCFKTRSGLTAHE